MYVKEAIIKEAMIKKMYLFFMINLLKVINKKKRALKNPLYVELHKMQKLYPAPSG